MTPDVVSWSNETGAKSGSARFSRSCWGRAVMDAANIRKEIAVEDFMVLVNAVILDWVILGMCKGSFRLV